MALPGRASSSVTNISASWTVSVKYVRSFPLKSIESYPIPCSLAFLASTLLSCLARRSAYLGPSSLASSATSVFVLSGRRMGPSLLSVSCNSMWLRTHEYHDPHVLRRFVPEFDKYTVDNAIQAPDGSLTPEQGAALMGARMIGRWKSGAPIDLFPRFDNATAGTDTSVNNSAFICHFSRTLDLNSIILSARL
jgi:hypothetical protein